MEHRLITKQVVPELLTGADYCQGFTFSNCVILLSSIHLPTSKVDRVVLTILILLT
jgi:hypothetical protein